MAQLSKDILNNILDKTEDWIDANDFGKVYRFIYGVLHDPEEIGAFSEFLLNAGVNPLEHMDNVPIAFLYGTQDIDSVEIPANIKRINRSAFQNSKLRDITFEGPIDYIGDYAFMNCADLTSIDLPDGIKGLKDGVFSGTGLTRLEIPTSIEIIGNNVIGQTKCIPVYKGSKEQ